MRHSETLGELAAALSAVQSEMRPAAMNAKNPHLRNKYADLGAIIETSRPALTKHGIAVSQMLGGEPGTVSVETVLMHKSGEWIASTATFPVMEQKGITTAQAAGISYTYLRRYAMAAALGIYADEDADGHMPPPTPDPKITDAQLKRMHTLFSDLKVADEKKHPIIAYYVGHEVESSKDLTQPEAKAVIDGLVAKQKEFAASQAPTEGGPQ